MPRAVKVRFEAKPYGEGRQKVWRAYDRLKGCNPVKIPGFGEVRIDLPTEAEAQAECDRLTTYYEKD